MNLKSLMQRASLAALLAAGLLSATALAQNTPAAAPAMTDVLIPNYSEVTDARLLNPEPENWLIYKGSYSQQGYSPLDQINTDNVANLVPVWTYSTGQNGTHEGAPIVNNGLMFATGANSSFFVLDAVTGALIWSYVRDLPQDVYPEICCGADSRGVALYGNNVYFATLDAHLLAFDAQTGKMLWDETVADYTQGYTITLAPLAASGKVLVGISGNEYGVRGFVQAFDAETGESAWKTYTTAAPDQPGGDTWPGDTYEHGGAGPWVTGSYDPETNITYWGTGNGGPWMGQVRPGDNLFVSSVVGLDIDTGDIKSFYQYSPNETWDYDEVSDQTLVTITRDGKEIKGLIHVGRNGQFYLLDRENTIPSTIVGGQVVTTDPTSTTEATSTSIGATAPDRLGFIYGEPYMKAQPQTITGFETDGRPVIPDDHRPGINKPATSCPFVVGGVNWSGLAFSPDTGYAYIGLTESCQTATGVQVVYKAGQNFVGSDTQLLLPEGISDYGAVQAIDVATGKVAWRADQKLPVWAAPLVTKGGLVFIGDIASREFRAYDAKTGEILWRFTTNSGVSAVPTTFEVDGVQYIAVESGSQNGIVNQVAKLANVPYTPAPDSGVIWVFALNGQAANAQSAATTQPAGQ